LVVAVSIRHIASVLIIWLFSPGDGGDTYLRNVSNQYEVKPQKEGRKEDNLLVRQRRA
jgi:hypothetical protein